MENELIKRAEDLARRADNRGVLTCSGFLSPAEQYSLTQAPSLRGAKMIFRGGHEGAERAMAFFLPDWMEEDMLDVSEYICALEIKAFFGRPAHRDYMGSILGMGVGREWVGDIIVEDDRAIALCQPSVLRHLLSIEKVGHCGVKTRELKLEEVPQVKRKTEELRFTVMSLRLDAVCAGMFRISRTEAARHIEAGNVSLNYTECLKCDREIKQGDIISLRGAGKGTLSEIGGNSRKGRIFLEVEIYK